MAQHIFGQIQSDQLVAVFGEFGGDDTGAAGQVHNFGSHRESVLLQVLQQVSGEGKAELFRTESIINLGKIAISIHTHDIVVS